jgi:hypothetical protein
LELPLAMERVRRQLKAAGDGDRQLVLILTTVLPDGLDAVGPPANRLLSRRSVRRPSYLQANQSRTDWPSAGCEANRLGSPQPDAWRAYTYFTTKEFLIEFGLDTLPDLPEFEAVEDAGLLSKEKLLAGDVPAGLANGRETAKEEAKTMSANMRCLKQFLSRFRPH